MSLYCKNCGTELNVDGQKIAVCDFCGMEQTLPTADDPKKLELFAKANEYRIASRFDLAKKQYESIIAQYPDDNEAYWCKLLCVYGIEYVEDSLTEKKLPTCHRTVTESIFDNSEYKLIMSRATAEEKAIYESEAKEIDRIQKEILAKVDKEEPYDIFICYKESENDSKKRTVDAQYATKIYTYLTEHGYKVFFSRITLKGKLGSEYEPVIYSALKSAKVMLHVTTSVEHTNAPWVRNEWSRFLEFMNGDVTKTILPCIAQMGPYELPDELSKFQVADMTDLDFYENLLNQVDRKFGRERVVQQETKPDTTRTEPASRGKDEQINNLINRAKLSLSYNDWAKASELAEAVLNIDYKCAEAYVIKLMCDFKTNVLENLVQNVDFLDNANYKQALQFADNELKITLVNLEKQYYYEKSKTFGENLLDDSIYNSIKECLEKASGYKDADKLLASLPKLRAEQEKAKYYNLAVYMLKKDITVDEDYKRLVNLLTKADDYKDAKELLASLPKLRAEQEKAEHYKLALQYLKSDLTVANNYKKAEELLEKADDYKDAKQLLESLPQRKQEQIDAKILAEKKKNYDNAIAIIKLDMSVDENYNKAKEWLIKADDYKDAKEILKKITAQREELLRKEKRKKKIARLIVVLSSVAVILIATIITIVCVTDYNARDGLKMQLKSDYYVVTGIDGKAKSSYKIPSTYQGKPVKEIGKYAFSSCDSLTSIEIPESVTSIGESAFFACNRLTSIEIPNSVTRIGNYAFSGCSSLTSIEIPDSVTSIGEWAFSFCGKLTRIEIPDSVTSIGDSVFENCSSLTSIEIPDSVTSIGNSAFYNCNSLTSIEIPNSVTSIGGRAFCYCSSLTSITIPFVGATKNGKENTHFGYIFGGNVPTSLKTVVITGGKTIGNEVFSGCSGLTSIEISASVTSIGASAFYNCSSLTSIEIPNSVTSIGNEAFSGCSGLTSIEIPTSVTSIGASAFLSCYSLTNIEIPNSVTSIGGWAFSGCNNLTIYCEAESQPSGWHINWNASRPIVWGYMEETGVTENGVDWGLTSNDTITITGYSGNLTELIIPEKINGYLVTTIKGSAFSGCSGLTSIEIPNSVTSIGNESFSGCSSLTSIEISASLTSIGASAFLSCSSLTSIEIPDSVTSIGGWAFSGCNNLTIYCEAESKPSGWKMSWNPSKCSVVWGYKG